MIPAGLRSVVGRTPRGRLTKYLHGMIFGRSFSGSTQRRLLILHETNRISYASIYPFVQYAADFRAQHDVEIRLLPVDRLTTGLPKGLQDPTHVILQPMLTIPAADHAAMAQALSALPAGTVTTLLDTFANNDIRLAAQFTDIDFYFKKSLFADLNKFVGPTYGHTNLTEYYGKLYGLPDDITDWQVPPASLEKLRLSPNFLTDASLSSTFLNTSQAPGQDGRDIDLHARLGGTREQSWYGEMRRQAEHLITGLTDLTVAQGPGISRDLFLEEMRRAKICFSPFGYGELCWRDIEAIAFGAVLLKPDMSHLRTEPDLYRDDETYVACRWDFADVEEKIRDLLSDAPRRTRIAQTAFQAARDYLATAGPVSTWAPLFEAAYGRRVRGPN